MIRLAISLFLFVLFSVTSARSFVTTRPGPVDSFLPKPKLEVVTNFDPLIHELKKQLIGWLICFVSKFQGAKVCSYTVIIKTSCSSVSYTRDKISVAFGDVYGNEVSSFSSLTLWVLDLQYTHKSDLILWKINL